MSIEAITFVLGICASYLIGERMGMVRERRATTDTDRGAAWAGVGAELAEVAKLVAEVAKLEGRDLSDVVRVAPPDPEIIDGVPWCRRECALCIPEDGLAGWHHRCHAAGGSRIADATFDDSDWPVIADASFDDPEWREPCYPGLDAMAIRLALVRQGGGK